jgi:two-component system sensor histidine kinase AgrC
MTLVEYFIGAFACAITIFISGVILLNKKFKNIKKIRCLLLLPFSLIIIIYSTTIDNIIKPAVSLLTFYMIIKLIIQEKRTTSIIYGVLTYIIFIISEINWVSIISMLKYFFNIDLLFLLSKSIIGNIIIGTTGCIISLLLRDKINFYVKKMNKSNVLGILIQSIVAIFIAISSINYLYINNWNFSYGFILNTIIVLGSLFLIQSLLNQYMKNKEIVDKYSLLEEYMKTSADLVEKYSSTVHKYKNNLIAIKGYYKNDTKDGDNYIDSLLEHYETKKYNWFSQINYIPFDSIRYLIYYKLSKAEELNLKIFVNVSKDINKIKTNLLDINHTSVILEILGEYFDNALYASNESNEKELNFNIYLDDNKITFELANTYLNNIDLNSIYKNGYTTKGKGHGLGLYDVDKSIKSHEFLDGNIEIDNNYFIAKLSLLLSYFGK